MLEKAELSMASWCLHKVKKVEFLHEYFNGIFYLTWQKVFFLIFFPWHKMSYTLNGYN